MISVLAVANCVSISSPVRRDLNFKSACTWNHHGIRYGLLRLHQKAGWFCIPDGNVLAIRLIVLPPGCWRRTIDSRPPAILVTWCSTRVSPGSMAELITIVFAF